MLDVTSLANECGITTDVNAIAKIIRVESSFNPYAIGVVNGELVRQPMNKQEAITTAKTLAATGRNFSMGLGQVNYKNLARYHLSIETAFEMCSNLRATISIYNDCLNRALTKYDVSYAQLAAMSCYYSGNFTRGFIKEGERNTSYVERIFNGPVNINHGDITLARNNYHGVINHFMSYDSNATFELVHDAKHEIKKGSIKELRGH